MPYTQMPPEYWRERRKNNKRYQEQERDRNRRRRNTPERKATNRNYRTNRRARLRDAFVEHVVPSKVFERDLYICQRCFKQCPSSATVPDEDAPTVDHIVALANGGEHSYTNTQCLCFMCNSHKGAE